MSKANTPTFNTQHSLYRAKVFHDRLSPKKHRFSYNIFMFYVDIDAIDQLAENYTFISRNKFNVFSFRDKEHLQFPADNPDKTKNIKEQISGYLIEKGIPYDGGKIMLLTNFNVLGYNFSPVSFYYVFDREENPLCCLVEVQNTFKEMKPYLIDLSHFDGKKFHLNTTKHFYVSPFIDHDTQFDFNLPVPDENLAIGIDDYKDGERFFISTLTGSKKKLTNARLFGYAFRFPFITLRIIFLIHWQAMKLWFKKIPYHKKDEHRDLQRGVYRKKE